LSSTVDVNHSVEVQKWFLQLFKLGKHSDVTFIITENEEDHRIPAHRAILASQSEYFDRLLFGEMKEAHPDVEIPLQDTPLEAFQLLMKYTYCGKMKIEDQDLQVSSATGTYLAIPQDRKWEGHPLFLFFSSYLARCYTHEVNESSYQNFPW